MRQPSWKNWSPRAGSSRRSMSWHGCWHGFQGLSYEHIHMLDEIGKMAGDGLKQYEYMVAATITLVCRAAMEGGVTPAIAYAISDVYFQKLEENDDDSCLNSPWADNTALKRHFHGVKDIKWRPR